MKKKFIPIIVALILLVGGVAAYLTHFRNSEIEECTLREEEDNLIYRWSSEKRVFIGDDISSLKKGKDYVTCKSQVKKMSKYAKNYYLKHEIQDNIVMKSYVCFNVTKKLAENNPGMTAGEYCLDGGDDGTAYQENVSVLTETFKNINGIERCRSDYNGYEDYYSFDCNAWGEVDLRAGTHTNGNVFSHDLYAGCYVSPDGSSICKIFDRHPDGIFGD